METRTVEEEFTDVGARAESVSEAVQTRHSIRHFESLIIPEDVLKNVFEGALRSPSWKNSQPWKVYVVSGERRNALARKLMIAAQNGPPTPDTAWPAAYLADAKRRMLDLGMKIYGVAGIDRKDKEARDAFMLRNFDFFGAPTAAFITTTFDLNFYVGLDIGCYLNTVMLLARQFGLGTCPQAALSAFPDVVREELALGPERVACGISIGYPTRESTLNRYHTPRETGESLVRFMNS